MNPDLIDLASQVLSSCRMRGLKLAAAESCTGGLIAAYLTEVAGSSDVFDRGFVTYSNQAKTDMLGVKQALLEMHGAVSKPVAVAMAEGALKRAEAVVAVTGIAGPSGGTPEKPVGLVHIAAAFIDADGLTQLAHQELRLGDIGRGAVREETVKAALTLLLAALEGRATLED